MAVIDDSVQERMAIVALKAGDLVTAWGRGQMAEAFEIHQELGRLLAGDGLGIVYDVLVTANGQSEAIQVAARTRQLAVVQAEGWARQEWDLDGDAHVVATIV